MPGVGNRPDDNMVVSGPVDVFKPCSWCKINEAIALVLQTLVVIVRHYILPLYPYGIYVYIYIIPLYPYETYVYI